MPFASLSPRATPPHPHFALTAETAPQVAEICRRLDGLPLAIELAAARMSHSSAAGIAGSAGSPSGAIDRRRPRSSYPPANDGDAIAWSYDLLSPDDRALFRRLAVFAGGFTLEAAERVTGGAESAKEAGNRTSSVRPPPQIFDILSSLVDTSLVQHGLHASAGPRYWLLETIRDYAAEQLSASGEEDALRCAHAVYFVALAEEHELADLLPDGERHLALLWAEHANLWAALVWLESAGEYALLLRLTAALGRFWATRGHYRDGRDWLERALGYAHDEVSVARAKASVRLGFIEYYRGEGHGASALFAEGLALCRSQNDAFNAAHALIGLGAVNIYLGDYRRATSLLEEAYAVAQAIPDRRLASIAVGWARANLGNAAREEGNIEQAAAYGEEGLQSYREAGFLQGTLLTLGDLANLAVERGDYGQALTYYREILDLNHSTGDPRIVIGVLDGAATAATAVGEMEQAARWLGAADALRQRTGFASGPPAERAACERAEATSRASLGEQAFSAAWEAGYAQPPEQTIAEVMDAPFERPAPSLVLTPRERDVLRLLVAGKTDRAIAAALFIGPRTVETHLSHIYAKLGVRSRAGAAAAAVAAGLVDPPGQANHGTP